MAALGAVFGVPSTTLLGSAPGRFKALGPSFHDCPRASFSVKRGQEYAGCDLHLVGYSLHYIRH